ncbi:zinc finger protein [Sesbania bispinosa]|nr:zinc finger protein [Sesbania bispinosa]
MGREQPIKGAALPARISLRQTKPKSKNSFSVSKLPQVHDAELCNILRDERLDITIKKDAADKEQEEACDLDSFSEFDVDLAEFATSVESLLGSGVDEDNLGEVFNHKEEKENEIDAYVGEVAKSAMVKVKNEEEVDADADTVCHLESVFDMTSEDAFHWNNIESVLSLVQEEKKPMVASNSGSRKAIRCSHIFFYLRALATLSLTHSPLPPSLCAAAAFPSIVAAATLGLGEERERLTKGRARRRREAGGEGREEREGGGMREGGVRGGREERREVLPHRRRARIALLGSFAHHSLVVGTAGSSAPLRASTMSGCWNSGCSLLHLCVDIIEH